jgi:hypothetical protein
MTPSITQQILTALGTTPDGLTSREVCALTRMTSYTVSGKLSKLACWGRIDAVRSAGARIRYRLKPPIATTGV